MSRNNLQFVNNILDRIKEYYQLKSDQKLANFLEVHRSTVSAWRRRGAMDYGLILHKCSDPDLNWLIYGEAPLLGSYTSVKDHKFLREKASLSDDPEQLKILLEEYRKVTKIIRELISKLPE